MSLSVLFIGDFVNSNKKKFTRLTLRIPVEISDWLKVIAEDCSRSMNGQIVEYMKKMKEEYENDHA